MFSFSMSFKIELTWLIPSDCNVLIKHLSWLCSPKSHTFWAMSRSPNVAWMKTVITKNALILSKKKVLFFFCKLYSIFFQNSSFISFDFCCQTRSFCFIFFYFSFTLCFHEFFLLLLWKKFTNVCTLQSLSDNWRTQYCYRWVATNSAAAAGLTEQIQCGPQSAQQSARLSFGVDLQLIFTLEFSAHSQLRRCCSSYVPRGRFLLPVHSNNNRNFRLLGGAVVAAAFDFAHIITVNWNGKSCLVNGWSKLGYLWVMTSKLAEGQVPITELH